MVMASRCITSWANHSPAFVRYGWSIDREFLGWPSSYQRVRMSHALCPRPGYKHYYILTDTTDKANAAALGLNHSPKLAFARGGATTAYLDFEDVVLVDRVGEVCLL